MNKWITPLFLGSALLQVAWADGRAIYNPAEHSAAIANIPSDTTPGSNPSFNPAPPIQAAPPAVGPNATFTVQPQNTVTAPAANYSGPMSAPPAAAGASNPAGGGSGIYTGTSTGTATATATNTGSNASTGMPGGMIR